MKVRDLIEQLSVLDQDAEVELLTYHEAGPNPVTGMILGHEQPRVLLTDEDLG